MDIENLIERLEAWNEQHLSVVCGNGHFACDYLCENEDCIVVRAATAISTLQAENKRLNKIVCSIPTTPDSGRTVSQYDKEMSMCAYLDDLEAENEKLREKIEDARLEGYAKGLGEMSEENEKLRAELERVKEERDAVVESIPHECKTCMYHTVFFNGCTLDHDCTNPDGGCSNNYDRWRWRGPHKED